ncbi:hypothetical protein [Kribbella sp. NPDC055071]
MRSRRPWFAPAWAMLLAIVLPVLGVVVLFGGGLAMAITGLVLGRPVLGWSGVALVVASVVILLVLRRTARPRKTGL